MSQEIYSTSVDTTGPETLFVALPLITHQKNAAMPPVHARWKAVVAAQPTCEFPVLLGCLSLLVLL